MTLHVEDDTLKTSATIAVKRSFVCLKLLFYHTFTAVPCSSDNFNLVPLEIMPNDYVSSASEHDILTI